MVEGARDVRNKRGVIDIHTKHHKTGSRYIEMVNLQHRTTELLTLLCLNITCSRFFHERDRESSQARSRTASNEFSDEYVYHYMGSLSNSVVKLLNNTAAIVKLLNKLNNTISVLCIHT